MSAGDRERTDLQSSPDRAHGRFAPGGKAWACALFFTGVEAMMSPMFLFRAYSMPITPLLIPVLVYPLCRQPAAADGAADSVPEPNAGLVSRARRRLASSWRRQQRWRQQLGVEMFTREEMVWITSVVAAGGSFAPAYQWLATIDIDFGRPLTRWQQLGVVLGTQLFGWSLGHMLRHVLVGSHRGMVWPDTLPLSCMIQALYAGRSQQRAPAPGLGSAVTITTTSSDAAGSGCDEAAAEKPEASEAPDVGACTTSRRRLALLAGATFVYQVLIGYIAPIFKSLCLLCLWAPQSQTASRLGSGWSGAGILALTFDWEALGTLQPLITPLWAQVQYYAGALLAMYVLTPVGWHLDWWRSRALPIVSTNVFDTMGNAYNISLVHRFWSPDADAAAAAAGPDKYTPGLLVYRAYSPVRLTVNSALGYICSVAAITAATVHLALWHLQWLRRAAADIGRALLRLWDPRPLFRTRRDRGAVAWDVWYVAGRVGRVLVLTLTVGVAILSPQLGISALPGWQTLIAVCWAVCMCVPVGFVEAVAGFTLPMDLLPFMFGGQMQGPGTPIETSYFHLWATVPVRVALGWPGVRSFQLAHHCCPQPRPADARQRRPALPWLKRGLLVGIVWGACVNHLSYMAYSRSLDQGHALPVENAAPIEDLPSTDILLVSSFDMSELDSEELSEYLDSSNDGDGDGDGDNGLDDGAPDVGDQPGWREPGEFGRLPAALSSELVVWGIVGPQSLFSADSPYRLLFVHGALLGTLLPPLFFAAHRAAERLARSAEGGGHAQRAVWLRRLARAARAVQVPLVLAGMVAVPTVPANFALSGLAIAVGAQLWLRRRRGKSLVDVSLYSAMLYVGTRMAIVGMFAFGEILAACHRPLPRVSWWGNQTGNVERCIET